MQKASLPYLTPSTIIQRERLSLSSIGQNN